MSRYRLALLAAFALAALHGSGQDAPPAETTLKVLLPQKRARVTVNGEAVSSRGSETREFPAPALAAGKAEYEVTVTWRTNDYTRFYRTAKATPKPGATVTVDLSKADPKAPDRIEIRYVPTPDDVVARMCKLGGVGKADVVYDLGCGDGRMVIAAVA
ncbi:MAG: TIGR03000 domain-containing protein, partial [Gemmataceae bacterium]